MTHGEWHAPGCDVLYAFAATIYWLGQYEALQLESRAIRESLHYIVMYYGVCGILYGNFGFKWHHPP